MTECTSLVPFHYFYHSIRIQIARFILLEEFKLSVAQQLLQMHVVSTELFSAGQMLEVDVVDD